MNIRPATAISRPFKKGHRLSGCRLRASGYALRSSPTPRQPILTLIVADLSSCLSRGNEMMILMLIEDFLADLGCESVTSVATVEQALAMIETQNFDAATLDINLDGRDSYPIADAVAARGIPFAFSTGFVVEGLRSNHRDRPVLRKPFRSDEFTRILSMLITDATSAPVGQVAGG